MLSRSLLLRDEPLDILGNLVRVLQVEVVRIAGFDDPLQVSALRMHQRHAEHDCPGTQNLCQGQNYENVYLEGEEPARGTYIVTLRLEALGDAEPPVSVSVGARIGGATRAAVVQLKAEDEEQTLRFSL